MKNKKDEDEWKYSEELGFPPLKEKYKRPWPGRKPRKIKYVVEDLGELIFNSASDLCEYTGLRRQTIYLSLANGGRLSTKNIHIEYIDGV